MSILVNLTRQQAQEIRDRALTNGEQNYTTLALEYNVKPQTIRKIVAGTWALGRWWDRTLRWQPYWPPSDEYQRIVGDKEVYWKGVKGAHPDVPDAT